MVATPTAANALTQLGKFILAVLPGVVVVQGQQNRIPEPQAGQFVVMIPTRFDRLRTNEDETADGKFTGSIAGTAMTITAVDPDSVALIEVGSQIFGVDLAIPTTVTAIVSGSGGVGVYTVSPAQTIASRTLSAGRKTMEQGAQMTVLLDFHGDQVDAMDLASTVMTAIRDEYGVEQFATQTPDYGVRPLYADDARQLPFQNAEQQTEWRWTVEAMLQVNAVVSVPQQFADSVTVDVVSIDATYPPTP